MTPIMKVDDLKIIVFQVKVRHTNLKLVVLNTYGFLYEIKILYCMLIPYLQFLLLIKYWWYITMAKDYNA